MHLNNLNTLIYKLLHGSRPAHMTKNAELRW